MIFTSLYTNPPLCSYCCRERERERERREVTHTEWHTYQLSVSVNIIALPIICSAWSSERFHTLCCRCLPWIPSHQCTLSRERHIRSEWVTLWVMLWIFLLQRWGLGFTYLFCHSCSPSLSCVSSTWARRGHQTGLRGQERCTSLYCRNTVNQVTL